MTYAQVSNLEENQEAVRIIQRLKTLEPEATCEDDFVLWDRAKDFLVFDRFGNQWIDFTSGIFVANTGHSHPRVKTAIQARLDRGHLFNYLYATEDKLRFIELLLELTPQKFNQVVLYATGSETNECALKLSRIHGQKINPHKVGIIGFEDAFHGKTLGSLMIGGKPKDKVWMPWHDPAIYHLPYPDYRRGIDETNGASFFKESIAALEAKGVKSESIAAVFMEPYQGWSACFFPKSYVQALASWAKRNQVLVIFDEVQSGFGRTGMWFAYEHFGVEADLVCCGKGISSSLPLSAVLGPREILNHAGVTSTHTGNVLSVAAGIGNLEVLHDEKLVERSNRLGAILLERLEKLQRKYPERIKFISSRGLLAGIHFGNKESNDLDVKTCSEIVRRCIASGLLLIKTNIGTIKIGPPLTIAQDALEEGLDILEEAVDVVLARSK
ncbi:MAG: aminotransferase class III-fold pyridoxal phosphate-dependent enzyme [Candidatus Sungiibacteriota bacterium]|uniref:Aminotransferase class III-fold pyridoxal phosphate-dependent enzyme n=1 Tax=Candidatus Sungiibacteriota bacterium TaxID=2750080 RepID=A0A7T5RJR7_9BACT|nr:MAG: aminotransferase class III-fold pyridoxal phosphate-dependent enzyme [Candidatus Sungbacteria bacterium]